MRVLLQSLSAWFGNRVDKVMLPSLSAWYWTYGGQGHAAVSVCLVLDIGWTGSCCRLFLSGIGHKVDKVMPPSQPVSLVLDIWWTGVNEGHATVSIDQSGIEYNVVRVMLSSLSVWYWT